MCKISFTFRGQMSYFSLFVLVIIMCSCVLLFNGCKKAPDKAAEVKIYTNYYVSWGRDDTALFYTQWREKTDKHYVLFRYDIGSNKSQEILELSFESLLYVFPDNHRVIVKEDPEFYIIDVQHKTIAHAFSLLKDIFPKTGKYVEVNLCGVFDEDTIVLAGIRNFEKGGFDLLHYTLSTGKVSYIAQGSTSNIFSADGSGVYYYLPNKKQAFYYFASTNKAIELPSVFTEDTQIEFMNKDVIVFSFNTLSLFRLQDQKIIQCPPIVSEDLFGRTLSPEMQYTLGGDSGSDMPFMGSKASFNIRKTDDSVYKWLVENSKI